MDLADPSILPAGSREGLAFSQALTLPGLIEVDANGGHISMERVAVDTSCSDLQDLQHLACTTLDVGTLQKLQVMPPPMQQHDGWANAA